MVKIFKIMSNDDSQDGYTTVFVSKKPSQNTSSKSNDEIIDLTNNNNDDIIGVLFIYFENNIL